MNKLGISISRMKQTTPENTEILFRHSYDGNAVSFEGFFGDMFKRIFKSSEWKGENPLELDQDDKKQIFGRTLGPIFKKTLLNPRWVEKNPGKEVEVSNLEFNLAFLFDGEDIKKSISDYFRFREEVKAKFKPIIEKVHVVENSIVNEFEENPIEIGEELDKWMHNAQMKMIETWERLMKPFTLKFKDYFEVSFYLRKDSNKDMLSYFQIEYEVKWLRDLNVTITPEQMINFIKFLEENKMYSPWSFQVTWEVYEVFSGGPDPDDGKLIFDPNLEFYNYSYMFTYNECRQFTLVDHVKGKELDMMRNGKNSLMSLIDKMFGSNQ